MNKWEREINSLNSAQREAVETLEGPVMVMAGPGTGKTQVLTLRIAKIIQQTDVGPSGILALTFTEAAAANMRNRLVNLIGSPGYYVNISTFHGLAGGVMQEYPEFFPEIIGGRLMDNVSQIEIVEAIIKRGDFKEIKPMGNQIYYVKDIINKIRDLKREGFSAGDYKEIVKREEGVKKAEKQVKRSYELCQVYKEYEKVLREKRLYDFEDMILKLLEALNKQTELLSELQEKYQYILVDEHQDTNRAQNLVVERLGSFYESPNIFVVGDLKQAIYKFQGASLENFLYFAKKYRGVKIIKLLDNYRSHKNIIAGATRLIKNNPVSADEEVMAVHREGEEKIRVIEAEDRESELNFIAKDIKKKDGDRGEVAVIYRENKEGEEVAGRLRREGIPVTVESDIILGQEERIEKLLIFIRAIYDFGKESLIRLMHLDFLEVEPLDIYRAVNKSGEERRPLMEVMLEMESLKETAKRLAVFKKDSYNLGFLSWLEKVIKESGWLDYLMRQADYLDTLERLEDFWMEIKKMTAREPEFYLPEFINQLDIMKNHNLLITGRNRPRPGRVRLMTAHRAKGLEFESVYITGAVDKKWGNKRRRELFVGLPRLVEEMAETEGQEDERRLFYMGLTRAKKELVITYATSNTEGRALTPAQFIGEIGEENITRVKAERVGLIFLDQPGGVIKEDEREFLRELVERRGLSVTALNNYLICPWKYFYTNLIRIPAKKSLPASFGSIIHATLRSFFEVRKKGKEAGREFLEEEFRLQADREGLNEGEKKQVIDKGIKILPLYYKKYKDSWNYRTLNELKVQGIYFDKINLNGKLDKLERLDDSRVVVVDYKTGKVKSRNEIEGKTKNSTGDYKRQLVFYAILLDGYHKKYKMEKGVLDFIEPNERGIFKKEEFVISEEEKRELEELIKKTWEEIIGFSFWNEGCEDKNCEYCRLAEYIKNKGRS